MNTQYQLCFYSGSLTGKIFPIVKEETKIGRDPSCDIVLTENSVSRIHVFLYVQQNGAVVLVDNNSTNGTVVNNYQISAPVQLSENDVIGLGGDVMLVFQKVTGYDPGSQWNGTDMPAGNAPDSYNFEKKQGNPMNNENNYPNEGAMNGFAPNTGDAQQQPADNFGFNQAYNANYGMPGMNQDQQMPYGYSQPNQLAQNDVSGFNSGASAPASSMPVDNVPSASDAGQNPVSVHSESNPVSQFGYPGDSVSQQQMMGQQSAYGQNPYLQQPFGNDPYGQQQAMGMGQPNPYAQNPYMQQPMGNDPYSQQQPMGMGQQNPYGNDPYSQQQAMGMGQQPYGNDPYSQQQAMGMGQQNPYGNDPYSQQQAMGMGQQNPYGNDPYSQQQPMGMGQQNPYGNDPYAQQAMGMGQQNPYGNDPYAQQAMGMGQQNPYGNDPYAQQAMGMGQQNPYGNDPYAQQAMGMGQLSLCVVSVDQIGPCRSLHFQ